MATSVARKTGATIVRPHPRREPGGKSNVDTIESTLVENRVFPPDERAQKGARIAGMAAYEALCKEAETDLQAFWASRARDNLVWTKPFTRVLDESNAPFYKWFDDGELNASANCLDKHMGTPIENKTAIIFEADDGAVTKISYKDLLARVSQFANALKQEGIGKGDRVIVYMPMTIEGVIAMQACARIGATHSVVFGGFSAKALQERIIDAGAMAVITANYQLRGGKELPLKAIVDEGIALGGCESVKTVLVYERTLTDWKRSKAATRPSPRCWKGRTSIARRRRWAPSIPSSSSTPPAPPASPRACSTPLAATCCGRR